MKDLQLFEVVKPYASVLDPMCPTEEDELEFVTEKIHHLCRQIEYFFTYRASSGFHPDMKCDVVSG